MIIYYTNNEATTEKCEKGMMPMVTESREIALLVEEAIKDRSRVRKIISLLYNADMEVRFLGAKALGEVAKARPEFIRQVWGRILNATDDTMSCWGVAEGLGEIARNMPDLRGKILLRFKKFEKDESTCQGFVWAICRIGQVDIVRIGDFIPELIRFLQSKDVCMTGQVIWALGELRITGAAEKIRSFIDDERETWIYENDSPVIKRVSMIAEEALKKLAQRS